MPIMAPVMGVSFLVLVGTGFAMSVMLGGGSLAELFGTTLGIDILIGIIATFGAMIVGFGILTPTGIRMDKMGRAIVATGKPPTEAEAAELLRLSQKVSRLSRINFIFVVLALATMLASRFL